MHDVEEGNLRYLEALKQQGPPQLVPLGSKGNIDGDEYVVAGFLQRGVTIDQENYFWTEYLLFNQQKGYRWLVESDHHWSFVWPINAGDISDSEPRDAARTLMYEGRNYRKFGDAEAWVEYVLGEFYWRIERGETVRAVDYTAPPLGISKEISGDKEINYSQARYMTKAEVEKAFNVRDLPRPLTVGMMQPYTGGRVGRIWAALMAALLVLTIFIAAAHPRHEVLNSTFDFSVPAATSPDWGGGSDTTTSSESSRVIFTPPFTLRGGRNLEIEGTANVQNDWMYVSGDVGDEKSGLLEPFELPIEFYQGYSDGEHWSEGGQTRRAHLSALPAGTYTMRLEGQWDPKKSPTPVHLVVREGVFRFPYFLAAFLFLTIPAAWIALKRVSFENARWSEAQFTPIGTPK